MQATSLTGRIDGGLGSNLLTYGWITSNVSVNLATGAATGVSSGITNIARLQGGEGNDVLVGNGLSNTFLGSAGSDSIDGAAGSDIFESRGWVGNWSLTAANAGLAVGGNSTSTFANIETIIGGTALVGRNVANTWTFDGNSAGTLGTLAFRDIGGIVGGSAADTLIGPSAAGNWDWTISGENSGRFGNRLLFSGIENLTGGSSSDVFRLAPNGSLSGTLNAGAGSDTLSFAGRATSVSINLANNTATDVGAFSGFENFTGSQGIDQLTGPNAATTWTVTGPEVGTVGAITYNAIERLVGGTAADAFRLTQEISRQSGGIVGGAGVDSITGPVSQLVAGEDLRMNFFISGSQSGVARVGSTPSEYSEIESLVGGFTDDTFWVTSETGSISSINGGTGANVLDYGLFPVAAEVNLKTRTVSGVGALSSVRISGSLAQDQIVGPDVSTTWSITGPDVVSVGGLSISGFENLVGGTQADQFVVGTSGAISGNANGGDGLDTLTGPNVSAVYRIVGAGDVRISIGALTSSLSGIETVTAGTAADEIIIEPSGFISGGVTAGSASGIVDVLNLAIRPNERIRTNSQAVDGDFGFVQGVERIIASTGGYETIYNRDDNTPIQLNQFGQIVIGTRTFENFEEVQGDGSGARLVGPNLGNEWVINGVGGGELFVPSIDRRLRMSGIWNLQGGSAPDLFKFTSSHARIGSVNGGTSIGGADQIDLINARSTNVVLGNTNRILGELNADILGSFAGIERVSVSTHYGLPAAIQASSTATSFAVSPTGLLNVGGVAYEGFGVVRGGTATDTLTGPNLPTDWLVDSLGGGSLTVPSIGTTIRFESIENLTGGTAVDTFVSATGGALGGTINGGAGTGVVDVLDLTSRTSSTVQLGSQNRIVDFAAYTGIEQIRVSSLENDRMQGPNAATTFAMNATGDLVLGATTYQGFEVVGGGTSADIFTGPNVEGDWIVDGLNSGQATFGTIGRSVRLEGIENFRAGSAIDRFVAVSGGSLTGGIVGGTSTGIVDSLDLTGLASVAIETSSTTNRVQGVFPFSGIEVVSAPVTPDDRLLGPSGSASAFVVNSTGQVTVSGVVYNGIETLLGNHTSDSITGPNLPTTWYVEALNSGFFTFGGRSLGFESIENLASGTSNDVAQIADAGQLTGTLNLGTGNDLIDLSSSTTAVDVINNTNRMILGKVGVFTGTELVLGNSGLNNRVVGSNVVSSSWSIDSAGRIVVGAVLYEGFASIQGNSFTDTLTGPAVPTNWTIDGTNAGRVIAASQVIAFEGIEAIVGGSSNDSVEIKPLGSLSGNLSGGLGQDSLSYADWTVNVLADMSRPTVELRNASAILGNTNGFELLIGGSGDDSLTGHVSNASILVGGAGNDRLRGGAGRDLLIGGLGSDILRGLNEGLTGSDGDDILIAGRTIHDLNRDALFALLSEWTTTSRNFATRVSNLRGTGTGPRSNGSAFLNLDTVFADLASVDRLTGGSGQDWFWGELDDEIDLITTGLSPDQLDVPNRP